MSRLSIEDPNVRTYIQQLEGRLRALEERLAIVVSPDGAILAQLPGGTTMSTSSGAKTVVVGAVSVLDDFDDVPDGSTYLKVTGVSGSNQVQAGSIATGAVTNPKIGALAVDTAELAADAVTTAKINAGAVGNTEITTGADIAPSKILISGAVNLDDWRDSGDATKLAAAQLAGSTPNALNIATTNPKTAGFVRAGAVRAMNAISTDGITIAGNIEKDVTGIDDGASVTGLGIDGSGNLNDSGTGGGGTGEGGDPLEP